jgi:hypothetical protein
LKCSLDTRFWILDKSIRVLFLELELGHFMGDGRPSLDDFQSLEAKQDNFKMLDRVYAAYMGLGFGLCSDFSKEYDKELAIVIDREPFLNASNFFLHKGNRMLYSVLPVNEPYALESIFNDKTYNSTVGQAHSLNDQYGMTYVDCLLAKPSVGPEERMRL